MSVIILLIIIGVIVTGGFLLAFVWSVKSGQYDDTYSPAVRILFDDTKPVDASIDNTKNKEHKKQRAQEKIIKDEENKLN